MSRLLIYATGGTIASRYDEDLQGFVPALVGEDLAGAVPGLSDVADLQVIQLANLSSTFLQPAQVFDWARRVEGDLADPEVVGAVVTHGTATVEESAYLFDLVISSPKPVVFTAAMRTTSELISDGPRNLLCAARVAVNEEARGRGVLLVMNEQIHAAADVTKSDAQSLSSFVSPNWGPVGLISRGWKTDEITWSRLPATSIHIPAARIEENVPYLKTVMGSDGFLIDACVDAGARGLVLEGFGGGEITPYMADGVERARSNGVEVAVASRCLRGRPLTLYADRGEGKWLAERGVRFGGYLTGPKVRIKLMLALGLDQPDAIAGYF